MSSGPFTSAASAELRPAAPFGAEVFNLANRRRNRQPTVTLDERLDRAGLAIASHLFGHDGTDTTGDDGLGAHAGTMVAILATLAAEAALQAAEVAAREPLATTRDGWVYGGPADGLLFRYGNEFAGPNAVTRSVWDLVADAAARGAGAAVPSASDLERIVARAEAHLGTKPCPILTAPADFGPAPCCVLPPPATVTIPPPSRRPKACAHPLKSPSPMARPSPRSSATNRTQAS